MLSSGLGYNYEWLKVLPQWETMLNYLYNINNERSLEWMAGKPSSDLIETDLLLWSESADQLVKEQTDPSSQKNVPYQSNKFFLGPKIVSRPTIERKLVWWDFFRAHATSKAEMFCCSNFGFQFQQINDSPGGQEEPTTMTTTTTTATTTTTMMETTTSTMTWDPVAKNWICRH